MRAFYFIWLLAALWVTALFAHEAGHYLTAQLLGGTATVQYDPWLTGGITTVTGVSPDHLWIAHLSGGLLAAVFVWMAFGLVPFLTPGYHDAYLEIAAYVISLSQVGYGILEFERSGAHTWFLWLMLVSIPWGIGGVYYLLKATLYFSGRRAA